MTLEEAIKTAIEYETKIRDLYKEAVTVVADPLGKKALQMLQEDEQNHLDYLMDRLQRWKKTGKLVLEKLETIIPSREMITLEVEKLARKMPEEDRGDEKQLLSKALKVEIETSRFLSENGGRNTRGRETDVCAFPGDRRWTYCHGSRRAGLFKSYRVLVRFSGVRPGILITQD